LRFCFSGDVITTVFVGSGILAGALAIVLRNKKIMKITTYNVLLAAMAIVAFFFLLLILRFFYFSGDVVGTAFAVCGILAEALVVVFRNKKIMKIITYNVLLAAMAIVAFFFYCL